MTKMMTVLATMLLVILLDAVTAMAATVSKDADIVVTHRAPSALGPLYVLASNPRYFATPDGKALFVTGFHTWTDFLSFANAGPSSFTAMADYMSRYNVNLIRLWSASGATWAGYGAVTPLPFNRSGTCCASDGGNKFDLTSYNATFFNQLRADVEYAASKGMYVMPSLLYFYHGDFSPDDSWNGTNNINGTTNNVTSFITGSDATTWALQQAYLRHFLDTLGDEPNVLYEVSNEPSYDGSSWSFENSIVQFVHSYEASRGYGPHPVGAEMLSDHFGSSVSDFVIDQDYGGTPGSFSLGKPVIVDTDHTFGIGGGTDWWWTIFMNGNNALSMDDMHDSGLDGTADLGDTTYYFYEEQNRAAIRQTRTVATMVDMTGMVPRGDLFSTGLGMADLTQHMYVTYKSGGGSVTTNLISANGVALKASWINTADGTISTPTNFIGGSGGQVLTSPFGSASAALIVTGGASRP